MKILFRSLFLLAILAGLGAYWTPAAKSDGASQCYKAQVPVDCFIAAATARLDGIADPNERADAVAELLYALAATEGRGDSVLKAALELSSSEAVKPVKRMDLLYSIDLYGSAGESLPDQTFISALSRFAKLEKELQGEELVELYLGACAIIGWDAPFLWRWLQFAQSVCTPERLRALQSDSVPQRALLLAMTPVAMTFSENLSGFIESAKASLTWLTEAEKAAGESNRLEERDFIAFVGVLMHTVNSLCLEVFDQADAADGEVELALETLRRLEQRAGITGDTTHLRRQVVELLFRTGREAEAMDLLREMLARADADQGGKKIPAAEQIAILSLAARLAYEEGAARDSRECVPEGTIST